MTKWFHGRHRRTGESGYFAALDEQSAPGGYDRRCWAFTEIDHEPGPFETFDAEAGALVADLPLLEATLLRSIDAQAGEVRLRFITDTPGQALTYRKKEDEARDFRSGGVGPWPMLEAEADATGQVLAELAEEVFAAAEAWIALGAAIEAARVGAKKAVRAAATAEDKRAVAAIDWEGLLATAALGVLDAPERALSKE